MPNRVYSEENGAFRRGARASLVNMPSAKCYREWGGGREERRREGEGNGRARELRVLGSVLGSPRVHFIFGGVSSETDRLYGRRWIIHLLSNRT